MKKENIAKLTLVMALSTSVFFSQMDIARADDSMNVISNNESSKNNKEKISEEIARKEKDLDNLKKEEENLKSKEKENQSALSKAGKDFDMNTKKREEAIKDLEAKDSKDKEK